jgi:hypothetical protein
MLKHKSNWIILLAFGLLSAIRPNRGDACAMSFPQYTVGSSFSVETWYNNRPMKGIEVELSRETDKEPYLELAVSLSSDEKGQSFFHSLTPGRYFMVVKHAGIEGEAVELKVVQDEPYDPSAQASLRLKWPSRSILRLRQIAGTLIRAPITTVSSLGVRSTSEVALAGAKLSLTDALAARMLKTSVTDKQGRFAFADLGAGLYVVHILEDGAQTNAGIDGDLFVEVAADATTQELPELKLLMSDCGMGVVGKKGSISF